MQRSPHRPFLQAASRRKIIGRAGRHQRDEVSIEPGHIGATRIQIICPCGNVERFRAANEIIVFLLREENVRRWGGLTYSSIADPAFTGTFWNTDRHVWETERHVLIAIDAIETSDGECRRYAAFLHDVVSRSYARHGQKQQRIWVATHPVSVVHDVVSQANGKGRI